MTIEPHKRITGKERERLTKKVAVKYVKGSSIRSLAAENGRSYGFIHRLLIEAEVPIRARGGRSH